MSTTPQLMTSSRVIDPIDDLVINLGDKDTSATNLIPVIERDPILQNLKLLADRMKAQNRQQMQLRR